MSLNFLAWKQSLLLIGKPQRSHYIKINRPRISSQYFIQITMVKLGNLWKVSTSVLHSLKTINRPLVAPFLDINGDKILSRVAQVLMINDYQAFQSSEYAFEDLVIEETGVAEFMGVEKIRVNGFFSNDGIYRQTCDTESLETQLNSEAQSITELYADQDFDNTGVFIYDYRTAKIPPKIHIKSKKNFKNTGYMWFGVGETGRVTQPEDPPVNITITPDKFFENQGYMLISGTKARKAGFLVSGEGFFVTRTPFENSGLICLRNVQWTPNYAITGSGCISVAASEFGLKDHRPSDPMQRILMDPLDSKAILKIEVTPFAKDWFTMIYGFGKSCEIIFSSPMGSFEYRSNGLASFIMEGADEITHWIQLDRHIQKEDLDFDGTTLRCKNDVKRIVPDICECRYDFGDVPT